MMMYCKNHDSMRKAAKDFVSFVKINDCRKLMYFPGIFDIGMKLMWRKVYDCICSDRLQTYCASFWSYSGLFMVCLEAFLSSMMSSMMSSNSRSNYL